MFRTKLITILMASMLLASMAFAQDAYPPSGYDVVNTTADVSIYDPADSNTLIEVVPMEGYAVIFRSAPYVAAGDLLTIDTRMDTLLLSGFSAAQGDSIFVTLDRDGPLSTGQIQQITPHVDFPAESFFDVYYKITFNSAPNPPSPGDGSNDATYRGSLNFDGESQSAVLTTDNGLSFAASHSGTYSPDKGGDEFCIDCNASWKPENEQCGGDNNGGCNSQPPAFDDVACGDTVCGTAWADGGVRDTDWYQFTLDSQVVITVTGAADFDFVLGFVDTADCALATSVNPAVVGAACDVISVSRVAGPGTYWVFAAPNTGTGVNCGQNSEYWFTLECTPRVWKPAEPPHLVDTISQIPPNGRVYVDPRKRPVIDPATGDTVGWVWHRHNVDPPDPKPDTVPTTGIMDVFIGPNPPSPTQQPDDVIQLQGQAIILRGPVQEAPDGHYEVQTEMLSMDLVGSSPVFGQTILSLPTPAPGFVRSLQPAPELFPAESFFDVFYQVDFPEIPQTITPLFPPQMFAQIEALPPVDRQFTTQGEPHPVQDAQNPEVIIGWVRPIHWVQPPADTCDEQNPGDVNNSGNIDTQDLAYLTNYVNCNGPAPVPLANGDVNGDCVIDQADVNYLTAFLFQGGPPPVECTCVNPTPPDCDCTEWTAGVDTIFFSSFEIDVYDPNDSTVYLGTAYAFGVDMVVQRGAPYETAPGLWCMDTEILQLSGAGNSPLLGGPFTIGLSSSIPSVGQICMCDTCDDNWARSSFDVFFEVSTTQQFPNNLITGNSLMELPCDLGWDPFPIPGGPFTPPNGYSYVDPRKVPIYNAAGEIIGYTIKRHRVDDEPLGACCEEQTNVCIITTASDCPPGVGTYQGDGTSCDPNPCDTCTDWTGGVDTILYSAFEVEIFDPNDSTLSLGTATAFGAQMVVQRSDPYEVAPGIWCMDTEILEFSGSGNSPLLGGPFTIGLEPGVASVGRICMCDSCNDHWAESYFDIFYQITTTQPFPRDVLHGSAHMELSCDEGWDPFPGGTFEPPHGHSYNDPRKVPIYDADGTIIGYTIKRHRIDDDPMGACCEEQTGVCIITTEDGCPPGVGTYLGDGTVCDPNPCDTCTQWTAGVDTIFYSSFQLEVFDPNDSNVSLGTAYAFGVNMVVQRGTPYETAPGIWCMDTEILEFSGSGNSPLLGGPFTIGLDPSIPSTGRICMCDSCDDNWAESFFDIFYEISTSQPAPLNVLHGSAQMELPCDAQWNPFPGGVFTPPNGHSYNDPRKIPIYDADGNLIGYTLKQHRVDQDPLGACCEAQTGLCFITTQVDCEAAGGTYQGDNTGCDPNPCDTCTGWTPGVDTIFYSSFQVDVFDPTDSSVLLGTAYAFGVNMVVQRGVPYEVAPGFWCMDTEVLEFSGSGNSPLLGGPFTVGLDPNTPSTGRICMCDSCDDNWAESFFDIYYVIGTSLPFPDNRYYGHAQMELPCDLGWNPFPVPGGPFTPPNGHTYVDPRKVPIVNENGDTTGWVMKRHRVDKDPLGACCEQSTGLCFITTAADCENAQGTYQGDGTGCDPNPCDTCETGWNGGVDTIPLHDFEIELYDQSGTQLITTLVAQGTNMIVQRTAPFSVAPGIFRMGTVVLEMSGSGTDPALGGPFEVHLNPNLTSGGYIQMCDSCDDHSAESFFDIFYVITTTQPFPMDSLFGDPAQMHLPCSEGWDPFPGGVFTPPFDRPYNDPRIVPIFDHNGQVIGHTRKRHTPRGDEECCVPPDRMRGDVNCDGSNDISDLVYIVDYMFNNGPEPCCFEMADLNCDGAIDISDLVFLVDWMFQSGRMPCRCDCADCGKSGDASRIGLETMRKWSSQVVPRDVTSISHCADSR